MAKSLSLNTIFKSMSHRKIFSLNGVWPNFDHGQADFEPLMKKASNSTTEQQEHGVKACGFKDHEIVFKP